MASTSVAHVYEFGEFRLDVAQQALTRGDGEPIPLTPRAFDTLRILVERAGELLDRRELMAAVWPKLVVEDNNLDQQISLLRQALGDRRGEHRYIVTVPGRGFRFVVPVVVRPRVVSVGPRGESPDVAAATSSSVAATWGSQWPRLAVAVFVFVGMATAALLVFSGAYERRNDGAAARMLAVLPFKPMTAADSNESLELGMAETLIVGLASDRLLVSPLSSVRRYAGADRDALAAGRELGVDVVLEGYIQRSGEALRVSTRLLNVADGRQLWSQSYDEQFSDILTIQDSIALRILEAFPSSEPDQDALHHYTRDAEAYQLYLDGQFYRLRGSEPAMRQALTYFNAAIERDPEFALAYVGVAECQSILGVFGILAPHDTYPSARSAIDKALALAPDLGEGHAALGHIKMQYEMDWRGAEADYRRAIELNPNHALAWQWLGILLGYSGRFDEALAALRRAQALEPAAPVYGAIVGMVLSYEGRHDEAVEQLERALAMAPDMPNTRTFLAMAYLRRGDLERATSEMAKIASPTPGGMAYVGQIHALAGRRQEAVAEVERLISLSRQRYVSAYEIASIYASLGDVGQTFAWLERAFEERAQLIAWLPWDRAFDGVRSDSRYDGLVARLPAASR